MAKYYTNTEELTSIADAIRAKTGGSSSLVYPTGFVSAIQGITTGSGNELDISDTTAVAADVKSGKKFYLANGTSTTGTYIYDPRGEEYELLAHLGGYDLKLSETNYPNITLTGNVQTIIEGGNTVDTLTIDSQYSYYIVYKFWCNCKYQDGAEPVSSPVELRYIHRHSISYKLGSIMDALTGSIGSYGQNSEPAAIISLYRTSTPNYSVTASTAFLSILLNSISISNSNGIITATVKYPTVRAQGNSTIANLTSMALIDTDETVLHLSIDAYRCKPKISFVAYHDELAALVKDHHTSILDASQFTSDITGITNTNNSIHIPVVSANKNDNIIWFDQTYESNMPMQLFFDYDKYLVDNFHFQFISTGAVTNWAYQSDKNYYYVNLSTGSTQRWFILPAGEKCGITLWPKEGYNNEAITLGHIDAIYYL